LGRKHHKTNAANKPTHPKDTVTAIHGGATWLGELNLAPSVNLRKFHIGAVAFKTISSDAPAIPATGL
jgi:hypothetical protein